MDFLGDSDGEPEAQGHGHEAENQSSQENVTESLPVASEASQEEPDETDDEIPEGDEFVEWNEGNAESMYVISLLSLVIQCF